MSEAELIGKRIKGLSILAREKVASFLTGNRRSLFRGEGTDFSDLREYVPGDDMRHIDWRATARRQNTLIVREYDVERNTDVILLLDASASMLLGKKDKRIKMAVEAIASLAHAAILNKDSIGFAAYSSENKIYVPAKGGKTHEFFIYRQLLNLIPKGRTNIGHALKVIGTNLKRRSLIMVISDLHDNIEETMQGFRVARALHHEVQVLQVSDYGEYVLPDNVGKIKFNYPGSNSPETIDMSDPISFGLYSYETIKKVKELNDFKRKLRGLRVRVVETRSEDLIERILLAYYSAKSRINI